MDGSDLDAYLMSVESRLKVNADAATRIMPLSCAALSFAYHFWTIFGRREPCVMAASLAWRVASSGSSSSCFMTRLLDSVLAAAATAMPTAAGTGMSRGPASGERMERERDDDDGCWSDQLTVEWPSANSFRCQQPSPCKSAHPICFDVQHMPPRANQRCRAETSQKHTVFERGKPNEPRVKPNEPRWLQAHNMLQRLKRPSGRCAHTRNPRSRNTLKCGGCQQHLRTRYTWVLWVACRLDARTPAAAGM